jgi:hypothetical protein
MMPNACAGCATPEPPDRRHRLELFAATYGLTSTVGGLSGLAADLRIGAALMGLSGSASAP